MDTYEKKYKDALERARNYHKQLLDEDNPEWASEIEKIFPELKESDDERIRKGLVRAVSGTLEGNKLFDTDVTREEALAWLEKQGEQYLTDEEMKELLRTEYEKGRADAIAERQKPAWSEEDKEMFNTALDMIEWYSGKNESRSRAVSDWLKSLKDRCTWKPNEWQLKAIKWILDGDNPENWTVTLTNLYNDLKKL